MIEGAKEMQELIDFHRSMTFEESRAWAYSKKDEWDLFAITTTAEEKGLIKGIAKGREEGRVEEKYAIAQKNEARWYADRYHLQIFRFNHRRNRTTIIGNHNL